MIIAMPINNKDINANIYQSFGRAPYFLIYDSDSKKHHFIDNDTSAIQGGAGVRAAQTLIDNNVEVLIVPKCGENAIAVIKAAKIEVYKTISQSIKENIDAYCEGTLSSLTNIHPGLHHHRGN